jgi:sortase A
MLHSNSFLCQDDSMSHRYIKKTPRIINLPVLPLVSVFIGLIILSWVAWPILSFELFYNSKSESVITPLADDYVSSVQAKEEIDYTNAKNWFPQKVMKAIDSPVDTYLLSIPKLRINDAIVRIGTDDLAKNLIHFGGSGLPGQPGNAVVFGHSVLPMFYNPKNYLTIFSLLPTLKEKDDLYVRFDGVNYRYQIDNLKVTSPEDVSGLEQKFDDSYMTMVTCVPPGTYLKRLWVNARLVPFDKN